MKTPLLFLFLFLSLTDSPLFAKAGSIIQITRRFRMSLNDPAPLKDYFIDLGERDGVKVGDVFEISREIPVRNAESGGAWHLMKVGLGEIKVYIVGESTSVGRAEIEIEPSLLPITDYATFMLGDFAQQKGSLQKP